MPIKVSCKCGQQFAAPDKLIAFIGRNADTVRVRSDHSLVITRRWQRESGS